MREEFLIERHGGNLCECGCGQEAPIASRSNARWGHVKGEPMRFVRGHANRKHDFGYDVDANGCWVFRGYVSSTGYGYIGSRTAHRIYYERFTGPVKEGLQLDHLCRNRQCVNPDHLEPVTPKENIRRSPIAGRHAKITSRKLNRKQVRLVRESTMSNAELGRRLGVSRELIRNVRSGRHYAEVV